MASAGLNVIPGQQLPAKWLSDVIGGRYVVKVAGGYRQANAAGEQVDGVALVDGVNGGYGTVCTEGVYPTEAGAAVADGVLLMTDNVGRSVAWTAGNYKTGKSLVAAAAAGLNVQTLLDPSIVPG